MISGRDLAIDLPGSCCRGGEGRCLAVVREDRGASLDVVLRLATGFAPYCTKTIHNTPGAPCHHPRLPDHQTQPPATGPGQGAARATGLRHHGGETLTYTEWRDQPPAPSLVKRAVAALRALDGRGGDQLTSLTAPDL